jgi:hypothetical protein
VLAVLHTLRGNGGNDRIKGGPGDDFLEGASGNDVLCDTADDGGTCVTSGGTFFDGGDNADAIWYGGLGTCSASPMDNTSTAGNNSDFCGDSGWGTQPQFCESQTLTAEPAECTDPN